MDRWRLLTAAVLGIVLLPACDRAVAEVDLDAIRVTVTEFRFNPPELSLPSGDVTVTLVNDGRARHDLVVEGSDGELQLVAAIASGRASSGTVSLPAGTYTFYCSVPGHRGEGMEGTLTVTERPTAVGTASP